MQMRLLLPLLFFLPGCLTQGTGTNCTKLSIPRLPGFDIISITGAEVRNYNVGTFAQLNFCNISVRLTHQRAGDNVLVTVWLPLTNWNGRFQATGGGGFAAGGGEQSLPTPLQAGYSTASTDGGLTLGGTISASSGAWVLKKDGSLNEELLRNFVDRSVHDMAVVGKAVTEVFYGRKPKYNYFVGCSTGGRQGYAEAQLYPNDFDGILSMAPAIDTATVSMAGFWPSVVILNVAAPPQCVFRAYHDDIVATCDSVDGVQDGLISDPWRCSYRPEKLIGKSIACIELNGSVTVTEKYAEVISRILEGPAKQRGKPLYFGSPLEASFQPGATTITANGTTTAVPQPLFDTWVRYPVLQQPNYDTSQITFDQFFKLLDLSIAKFERSFGVRNPNLSAFRARGGRILSWHGLADQFITPEVSIQYRQRLERNMGKRQVEEFHRLFLAPGVAHCSGGVGPFPVDALGALVKWVECKVSPETLHAAIIANYDVTTRNLCKYPQLLKYKGGDVKCASSFYCK